MAWSDILRGAQESTLGSLSSRRASTDSGYSYMADALGNLRDVFSKAGDRRQAAYESEEDRNLQREGWDLQRELFGKETERSREAAERAHGYEIEEMGEEARLRGEADDTLRAWQAAENALDRGSRERISRTGVNITEDNEALFKTALGELMSYGKLGITDNDFPDWESYGDEEDQLFKRYVYTLARERGLTNVEAEEAYQMFREFSGIQGEQEEVVTPTGSDVIERYNTIMEDLEKKTSNMTRDQLNEYNRIKNKTGIRFGIQTGLAGAGLNTEIYRRAVENEIENLEKLMSTISDSPEEDIFGSYLMRQGITPIRNKE